jgi:PIN domain nuclease of toxin-antitoxin system
LSGVVADTHAIIWLLLAPRRLSLIALEALNAAVSHGSGIAVAPISLAEIVYLKEKGRVDGQTLAVLLGMIADAAVPIELAAMDVNVAAAMREVPRDIVADMPDRIIAATALALGLPLVTRDAKIRALGIETVW